MTRLAAIALLGLALAACDRAVIEPAQPGLEVLSPDLGAIQTQPEFELRVGPAAGSRIAAVRVAGEPAVSDGDAFVATVRVERGLTALPLEGLGDGGEVLVSDTAYVVFATPDTELLPDPAGLGSGGALTVTALDANRVLVAGGEPLGDGTPAPASVLRIGPAETSVEKQIPLGTARLGHTATLTAEGDVLLVGGTTRRRPQGAADFATTVQRVSPSRGAASDVFLLGGTVRRSGHVTRALTIDGTLYLYLIGGLAPTDPPSVTRSFDVLRYEPGGQPRLVVLSPPGGAGDLPPLPAPLLLDGPAAPDGTASALLYGLDADGPTALRLQWAPPRVGDFPVGLDIAEAPGLAAARTDAAAAAAGDGLFLVSGGRTADGAVLADIEAVAFAAGRAFAFDAAGGLRRARAGHAATILGPGRILTLGGYDAAGFPVISPEITTL